MIGVTALLLIAGCAAVTPDKRFADVRQLVDERLGQRVTWYQGIEEDEAVAKTLAALLEQPLSVEQAVQIALLRNNSLQETFEDLGIAQADVVQAGLLRNPSIAGFFRFPESPAAGLNWNVGVDVWLLEPFLVPVRQRLAGSAEEEAIQRVSDRVLRLAADTRAAYYTLQADMRIRAQQEDLAEMASIAAELADRQFQAGNIDDLQLAAERSASQQAYIQLLQSRSAERTSRERLRQLMGLTDWNKVWQIATEAATPPAAIPSEEELVNLALSQRLDLEAARTDVRRLESALALTQKWWLATVRVGVETEQGSKGPRPPRSKDPSERRQERGGGLFQTGPHFAADIPLFDQKTAEIARQEALIRQATQRVSSLQSQVRTEVRTTLERMISARQIAAYYGEEVLPLRRKMLEDTQSRYNAMILGVYDLLNAKRELTTLETAHARALQDCWIAHSDLELAIGGRLPSANTPDATSAIGAPSPPPEPMPDAMSDMPAMSKPAPPTPANPVMPDMPGMPGMKPKETPANPSSPRL